MPPESGALYVALAPPPSPLQPSAVLSMSSSCSSPSWRCSFSSKLDQFAHCLQLRTHVLLLSMQFTLLFASTPGGTLPPSVARFGGTWCGFARHRSSLKPGRRSTKIDDLYADAVSLVVHEETLCNLPPLEVAVQERRPSCTMTVAPQYPRRDDPVQFEGCAAIPKARRPLATSWLRRNTQGATTTGNRTAAPQ